MAAENAAGGLPLKGIDLHAYKAVHGPYECLLFRNPFTEKRESILVITKNGFPVSTEIHATNKSAKARITDFAKAAEST